MIILYLSISIYERAAHISYLISRENLYCISLFPCPCVIFFVFLLDIDVPIYFSTCLSLKCARNGCMIMKLFFFKSPTRKV